MKTRKFWLSLLAALLCAALLCPAIAVAAGEEVIVQLETEANSAKPAATGDLALELDPGIDAPIADISNVDIDSTALSLDIGLTTSEGEGNDTDAVIFANEESAANEQTKPFRLKVIYSGPTLTKEYDLTRNCFKRTASGGYADAITPPNAPSPDPASPIRATMIVLSILLHRLKNVYAPPGQQQRRRHALPRQRQQLADQQIGKGYGSLYTTYSIHIVSPQVPSLVMSIPVWS